MLHTCNNIGRSQNNYTEFKKKKNRKKEYKHYDAAYVKLQENANQSTVTKSRSVIAWGEAELGQRDGSQRGTKKLWG